MNRRLCEVFRISSRLSRNQKLLDVQCSPSITRLRRHLAMHTSTAHNFSDTIYAVSSGSLLFFVQQSYVMNSDSDLVLQTRDVLLTVICMQISYRKKKNLIHSGKALSYTYQGLQHANTPEWCHPYCNFFTVLPYLGCS